MAKEEAMKFRVRICYGALAAVMLAIPGAMDAAAAPVEFATYANQEGEASVGENKTSSYSNPLPTGTGVGVSGITLSADGDDVPYLDSYSGGKPGGLGVCSTTNTDAQCSPSSDDNVSSNDVGANEVLRLSLAGGELFDFKVTEFRDANHNSLSNSANLLFALNGGSFGQETFSGLLGKGFSNVSEVALGYGGDAPNQFYLSSADIDPTGTSTQVPVPQTLALLGFALFGLGVTCRKRALK